MIRHIVIWNYQEGFSPEEKELKGKEVKERLEALKDMIDGVIELHVCIKPLSASTKDVILNSLFESEEALSAYQVHPAHKEVSAFVGTVMKDRVCMDYDE